MHLTLLGIMSSFYSDILGVAVIMLSCLMTLFLSNF